MLLACEAMPRKRNLAVALASLSMVGCPDLVPSAGPKASEVRPQPSLAWPVPAGPRIGPGWMIRDGVFEGLHAGLRVRAPAGWELFIGEEIAGVTTSNEVGLRDRDSRLSVSFERERVREEPLADWVGRSRVELVAALGLAEFEPVSSWSPPFLGAPVEFARSPSGGRAGEFEYLYGAHELEPGHIEILAWYPAHGDPEQRRARVEAALASVELLSRAELDALEAALARSPDPRDAIAEDWSLRGGVYRNFSHDLMWSEPSGMWAIDPDDPQASVVLAIEDREQLFGLFSIHGIPDADEVDALRWHETILETSVPAGTRFEGERQRLSVGAVEALVDTVRFDQDGTPMLFRIATIKHGELAAMWFIGGAEPRARANLQRIDRVIAQLRVGVGFEPVTTIEGRHVDKLAGWALRPRPGLRSEQRAIAGLGRWARAQRWSGDTELITVVSVSWSGDPAERERTINALGRQVERDAGLAGQAATEERAIELSGRPGYHRAFVRAQFRDDIVLIDRGRTLHALHVHGSGPELFEATYASFELLD